MHAVTSVVTNTCSQYLNTKTNTTGFEKESISNAIQIPNTGVVFKYYEEKSI
jgi:hypothetical protein